jgi:hypothetical protein
LKKRGNKKWLRFCFKISDLTSNKKPVFLHGYAPKGTLMYS